MRSGKGQGRGSEGRSTEGPDGGGWMSYLKGFGKKKTPLFKKELKALPPPPTTTTTTHFQTGAAAASLYLRNYRSSVSFPDPPPPPSSNRLMQMRKIVT